MRVIPELTLYPVRIINYLADLHISVYYMKVCVTYKISYLFGILSFISEPRTLKELLISERDFLNSFSPSRPIFKPKFSDILRHLLEMGIKKEPCGLGI